MIDIEIGTASQKEEFKSLEQHLKGIEEQLKKARKHQLEHQKYQHVKDALNSKQNMQHSEDGDIKSNKVAAEMLGISESELDELIKEYQLAPNWVDTRYGN